MLACVQSVKSVPRHSPHMLLGNFFYSFSSFGKYFLKLVHPSKFEYVVSLHILQGCFLFPCGLFSSCPLFLGLFLCFAWPSWKLLGFLHAFVVSAVLSEYISSSAQCVARCLGQAIKDELL